MNANHAEIDYELDRRQKVILEQMAQLQQLQSGQAPGPCGQQGHLMLHCISQCEGCGQYGEADWQDAHTVRGQDGEMAGCGPVRKHCILCERQAKLLEAAEWALRNLKRANPQWERGAKEVWKKHLALVGEARAAAAIAEEGK